MCQKSSSKRPLVDTGKKKRMELENCYLETVLISFFPRIISEKSLNEQLSTLGWPADVSVGVLFQ